MLDYVFGSILQTDESGALVMTAGAYLASSLASIVLGACIALIYMYKHKYSKNFVVTLAMLPLIVQSVICLVNGNIGAGVAVMGVFSLVRFRSVPGTAKDIVAVFMAMAVGLATGMGYLTLAVVFTVVAAIANAILVSSPLGESKAKADKKPKEDKVRQVEKSLKVTIPEAMDYMTMFDDLFDEFCVKAELYNAKTTNMGSLFQVEYLIVLADPKREKELIDAIRARNGNLTVSCGRANVKEREQL